MKPVLKIEIGTYPFVDKKINKIVVENTFSEFLDIAGIDIAFEVGIAPGSDFLAINNYVCRYPESLLKEVNSYNDFIEKGIVPNKKEDVCARLLIKNILWLQPQALIPDDLITTYMPALGTIKNDKEKQTLKQCKKIITELLELKISLKNKKIITEVSNKHLPQPEINWNDFREELIEALSGNEIAIYFNREYFDYIIAAGSNENLFELMREGLFYENGIKYPPFKIHLDDELPFGAFCFKINSFQSIPVIGLRNKQEILVNDTPDRLKLIGVDGNEAINPANGNRAATIKYVDKEKVEKSGLTTLNEFGYFILCFSGFLRKYGYLCINKTFVIKYLELFKLIFPKINEVAGPENSLSLTSKTLRLLAREEISIRNLRVIMEAIAECDYILADGNSFIIFDERIPVQSTEKPGWKDKAENIAEFVRTRLKRYISHKYTKGQSTLNVCLLDPSIENMVYNSVGMKEAMPDETSNTIFRAINNEMADMIPSTQLPVILTTVNVRPHIKRIIENKFPHIAVLSYQELSPEMNIQPLVKIMLD